MLISFVLLVFGLILLVKGADWLIDGSAAFARQHNVSDLVIGLTIVAFGTSAPELVVNTVAAYQGREDLVFGNVIGSNNFNLFIILGLSGMIYPLLVRRPTIRKEIPISILAIVILYILANDVFGEDPSGLGRLEGGILLVCFILFLLYIKTQLSQNSSPEQEETKSLSKGRIVFLMIIGFVGLVAGGNLVVNNATLIAQEFGVSEKVIGLTIVAAGTSLPELATSVMAAFKKNTDIAVGNIIGSNIFNIFLILGVSSLVRPLTYDTAFNTDLYLLMGGSIFLLVFMVTGGRKKLDRWEALVLLFTYLVYTGYLIWKEV